MDNELKDTLQLIIGKIGDMDNKLTKVQQTQEEMQKAQEEMQLDIRSINVRIENEIIPSIKTIAEGHQMLYDKISRIDKLSDEIDELKGAIVAVEILATGRLGN